MPYITSVERYGIEKGLEEGRKQGVEQGLEQGLRVGLVEGIAGALAAKFGTADKRLMRRVRQIPDVAVLRALLKAIPGVTDLKGIRELLPEPRE